MIKSAIHLRPALSKLCVMEAHNRVAKSALRCYQLRSNEWDILVELEPILDAFLEATLRLSRKNIPQLYDVIPVIDVLANILDEAIVSGNKHPAIILAIAKGSRMLNKYYSKTDMSMMYRMAMGESLKLLSSYSHHSNHDWIVLHPHYKLTYFRENNWEDDWITSARELVRTQWKDHYKPKHEVFPDTNTTVCVYF